MLWHYHFEFFAGCQFTVLHLYHPSTKGTFDLPRMYLMNFMWSAWSTDKSILSVVKALANSLLNTESHLMALSACFYNKKGIYDFAYIFEIIKNQITETFKRGYVFNYLSYRQRTKEPKKSYMVIWSWKSQGQSRRSSQ